MTHTIEYLEYELAEARYELAEAIRIEDYDEIENAQCRIDNLESELRHIEDMRDAVIGKASEQWL